MTQSIRSIVAFTALCGAVLCVSPRAHGDDVSPAFAKTLYEKVSPSMVAVQYTWAYEYGRIEFVSTGVVVRDDGLIVIPGSAVGPAIPDSQIVDFKIIIPSKGDDEVELDAVFQGRDERTSHVDGIPTIRARVHMVSVVDHHDVAR